jgi:hypothetical protein
MHCHQIIPAALLLALSATAAMANPLALAPAPAAVPRPATPPAGAPPAGDWAACRAAIRQVERGSTIPPQLLAAIGRVESGRRDSETGTFAPWPWTINAEGQGRFFRTRAEAIAEVRALQARGVRSMDVGCMQINLLHHPNAFPSLEAAFDPLANVTYAAKFLTELQATRNNWTQAAANYHSNTPEFAQAYQRRIQAAWPEETRLATAEQRDGALASWSQARAAGQYVPGGAPMLTNAPAPRTEGMRGRDLDSYRTQPVMPGRMGLGGLRRL